MKPKNLLCAVLAAAIVLPCAPPAQALSRVSAWAKTEVLAAEKAGLAPASLDAAPAAEPITRAEFCEIALLLYEKTAGKPRPSAAKSPFSDTDSEAVACAAQLKLVGGRGGKVFDPRGAVTRQELCKMLDNVLVAAAYPAPAASETALGAFPDKDKVAAWAVAPVARMLEADILRGVSRTVTDPTGEATTLTELRPAGTTTREQALLAALRFSTHFAPIKPEPKPEPKPNPTPDPAPKPDPDGGAAPSAPPAETPTEVPAALPKTEEEKMAFVFGSAGSFFASPTAAEAAMTEISVPVWRLKNGAKTAGKATVTVNRNLAAIYTAVFIEIYNGEEKFPISDVGSYAWRPSPTSEHRWGTAIDLNYDANMEATVNPDGTMTPTCGTHWTPGVDPLSIPEGGDVYNAFKKYDFSWGGNAWKTKRDYMHFSYFGR